jgi:signal transduction histidine kinase/CheY-like chemotaxis protein
MRFILSFWGIVCLVCLFNSCGKNGSGRESLHNQWESEIKKILDEQSFPEDTIELRKICEQFKTNGNKLGECRTLQNLGERYRMASSFMESSEYYKSAALIAREIADTLEIINALNGLGTDFRRIGSLKEAIDYHYEALSYSEFFSGKKTAKGRKAQTISLNGIGNAYLSLGELDEAEVLFRQALVIENELGSDLGQAINYANIGSIYFEKSMLDSAVWYYNASMEYNQRAKSELGQALCYIYLGDIFNARNLQNEALEQYLIAYNIMLDKKVDSWHWLNACHAVGRILLQMGNLKEAEKYLEFGLEVSKKANSYEHLQQNYLLLSDLWHKKGNDALAFENLSLSGNYADSISNKQNDSQLLDARLKYEHNVFDHKLDELDRQKEKQTKRRENVIIIFIAFSAILMVIIGIFYYKSILDKKQAIILKKIEKMRSDFFMNITHEFRTPITVILGLSKHLASVLKNEPADIQQNLHSIDRQGKHLLALVNQLLDFSKSESGTSNPQWKNGDVVAYLQMLIESYTQHAKNKGIELVLCREINELKINFVPDYWIKIFGNLLSNALKHCESGDSIVVHVSCNQAMSECHVSIKDTGEGILSEDIDHIFELYYRSDISKSKYIGSGIGLALTKRLTEELGGKITVSSVPEKETKFTVTLPIHTFLLEVKQEDYSVFESFETNYLDEENRINGSSLKQNIHAKSILVVEDSQDVSHYISTILSPHYHLFFASDGQEGLEVAEKQIPDLIITDIMMPVKNGYDFCSDLRKSLAISHIPIIMITARDTMDDKLKGLESGADVYLTKPFDEQELLIRVKKLLENRAKLILKYSVSLWQEKTKPENDVNLDFLLKVSKAIDKKIDNPDYFPAGLASDICLSESQLNRKLKALSGHTISSFVLQCRMNKAKILLANGNNNISEIANNCGFSDLSYFSRSFKKVVGMTPSEYMRHK